MDQRTLESFRRQLVRRGQSFLQRRQGALAREQQLLENREPDWEDLAADHTAAQNLDALAEADALAVARIRASLDRIARGTFGDCVICHAPIETERLRAMPDVEHCAGCTH